MREGLQPVIEEAWNNRELLKDHKVIETIREIIEELDKGRLRIAEHSNGKWQVNEWLKKAVILYFPIMKMQTIEIGPFEFHDKIPLKNNLAASGIPTSVTNVLMAASLFPAAI